MIDTEKYLLRRFDEIELKEAMASLLAWGREWIECLDDSEGEQELLAEAIKGVELGKWLPLADFAISVGKEALENQPVDEISNQYDLEDYVIWLGVIGLGLSVKTRL